MITHRLTGGSGSAQTFKTLWSRRRPEWDWFNDWTERQSFFSGIMCQCWSNHGGCVVLDETVVIWWQIRSRSEWEREGPDWKSPSKSIKARLLFLDTFRCCSCPHTDPILSEKVQFIFRRALQFDWLQMDHWSRCKNCEKGRKLNHKSFCYIDVTRINRNVTYFRDKSHDFHLHLPISLISDPSKVTPSTQG